MLRVPVSHVLNLVVLAFLLVSYLCSLESGARCGMSSERRTHPCSRRWRYRADRTASDDGVMRFPVPGGGSGRGGPKTPRDFDENPCHDQNQTKPGQNGMPPNAATCIPRCAGCNQWAQCRRQA